LNQTREQSEDISGLL